MSAKVVMENKAENKALTLADKLVDHSKDPMNLEDLAILPEQVIDQKEYLILSRKRVGAQIQINAHELPPDLNSLINDKLGGLAKLTSLAVHISSDRWIPEDGMQPVAGSQVKKMISQDAAYKTAAEQLKKQGVDATPLLNAISPASSGLIIPFDAIKPEYLLALKARIGKPKLSSPSGEDKVRAPRGSYNELASWLVKKPNATLGEVEEQARQLGIVTLNLSLLKRSTEAIPKPAQLKISIFS